MVEDLNPSVLRTSPFTKGRQITQPFKEIQGQAGQTELFYILNNKKANIGGLLMKKGVDIFQKNKKICKT
ncbi:MAG: hypothetical protein CO170_03100 [candidate division SR1 bacterium CG_4_9_14_3_um_filter_40_9]|nr:MAG: hypothetical protein CO170_03100 [candidate division SR1 bacterium CG_4_9_14_3_um_filter_40_9]